MTFWIASRFAPTYQGGLAAYTRLVIQGLQERARLPLTIVCSTTQMDGIPSAEDGRGLLPIQLNLSWIGRISKPLWNRFAGKSSLHGALESILHHSWQRLQESDPKVIHYVGTGWDFFGFPIAKFARDYQARFVITPAIHPSAWGGDRLDVRHYHQADRVICFTNQESKSLQRLGLPEQKLSVCPLPPTCRSDGDGVRFRKSRNLLTEPCVLFVGRRDQGKGYPALLRAWPLVLRAVPDAVLVLAGPGGDEYRELVACIPAHNVCDLGVPNEVEKADAIAACDIFCLPSAHESFGIVYVDAWSYGKPVVCGTAPACREFIVDGKNGLWGNQIPEELAEKLTALLQNRALRDSIGEAGKREQGRQFNEDTFFRSHFEAFGLSNL